MPDIYATAFKLLTLGYSVIPSGAGKDGKHPLVNWLDYQENPPTEDQLRKWQEELRPSLWGIVTGKVSGLVVLDADTPEAVAILEADGIKPHILTPNGAHSYCKHPSREIKNAVRKVKGVDWRGDGGFVNAIGKNPVTGGEYKIVRLPTPDVLYLWEKLPAEILAAMNKNGSKPVGERTRGEIIPNGQRNATMTRIGGAMRRQGADQAMIEAALFEVKCETPLPDDEIKAIAASVSRYEPQPDTRPQPFNWHDFAIEHDALLAKDLAPLDFLVTDLIALPGIVVLAAPKKRSKSWMALQLSQNIAAGVPFLGMETKQGKVIHLALEDGERRLRQRLNMQNAEPGLEITYITKFEPLNSRVGFQALKDLIKEKRPILVVIDTLAAAKDRRVDENSAGDTADLFNQLHEIALTENIVILIIAHHGKASTGDVGFDIRGSSAIPGATDVNIGLYKNVDGTFDLKAEGRDIGEVDLRVSFDADVTWCWHNEGDAKDVRRTEAENNIIAAIETLGGTADATAIATELDITRGTVQLHLKRMRNDGQLDYKLEQVGRVKKILYSLVPTSSSSSNHKHPQQRVSDGVDDVDDNKIAGYPDKPCLQCGADEPIIDEKTGAYRCSKCQRFYPQPKEAKRC